MNLEVGQAERLLRRRCRLTSYFPDSGPLRRELYGKHLEFFDAGREHRERLFCAGNRCGKTIAGAYETALHATGFYPSWWTGRRFLKPIDAWVAGQNATTTRDIVQFELLGRWDDFGTGMIPFRSIIGWTKAEHPREALDSVRIKHASGGISEIGFKAYSEGRGSFQGTAKHLIWFDEECSLEVYVEANLRTMIVPNDQHGGIVMVTFTPLLGWTEVVESFLGATENAV